METSRTARFALASGGLVVALIALELGCQLNGLVIYRRFAETRSRPRHYLQATENAVLGYELKPGSYDRDDRVLRINDRGIREEREGTFDEATASRSSEIR